jgi:hypothetical protein
MASLSMLSFSYITHKHCLIFARITTFASAAAFWAAAFSAAAFSAAALASASAFAFASAAAFASATAFEMPPKVSHKVSYVTEIPLSTGKMRYRHTVTHKSRCSKMQQVGSLAIIDLPSYTPYHIQ